MIKWFTFGLVLCAAGSAGAEWTVGVLSFNLRYGTAPDKENDWEHRKDLVTEVIRSANPGLFGTQECLDFQAEYLAQQLPEYRWIGIGRDADGIGEMTAMFYKKAEFVPVETGHFWLSEQPGTPGSKSWDSSLPRIASWALYYHPESRTFLRHVNTHLDHRGEKARAEGAAMLARRIAEWNAKTPVVLTGDFNAQAEESEPWRVLAATNLVDARTVAEQVQGPKTTWCGFKEPEPDGGRIDWIFVPHHWKVLAYESMTFNREGRYPSDHLPVLARLAF